MVYPSGTGCPGKQPLAFLSLQYNAQTERANPHYSAINHKLKSDTCSCYSHMPIGKAEIYRLLFVCLFVCLFVPLSARLYRNGQVIINIETVKAKSTPRPRCPPCLPPVRLRHHAPASRWYVSRPPARNTWHGQ